MSRWRSALVAALLLTASAATTPSVVANAEARNRAGLVVRGAGKQVLKMCVFFEEPSITGLELVERSNLPIVTDSTSLGTAICKIGNHGCASGDCFCKYPTFWGYWTRDAKDDAWIFSEVGVADREIRNGSVDGWTWGSGRNDHPPDETFDSLCGGTKQTIAAPAPATAVPLAQAKPLGNTKGNYAAFAGFVALFACAAGAASVVRRRRFRTPQADR
jgi:hypothetical protein